jgi:hypothetical protein
MDLDLFIGAMRGALYQCGQAARALKGQVAEQHKTPDSAINKAPRSLRPIG